MHHQVLLLFALLASVNAGYISAPKPCPKPKCSYLGLSDVQSLQAAAFCKGYTLCLPPTAIQATTIVTSTFDIETSSTASVIELTESFSSTP